MYGLICLVVGVCIYSKLSRTRKLTFISFISPPPPFPAACVTPYDSFAILPYQVIFTLALWVLACILQEVVGRRSEKFRSMSDAKRRNMVCYMIELIVTPICLASTLYYWRFLFLFTPLHVEDAKVSRNR